MCQNPMQYREDVAAHLHTAAVALVALLDATRAHPDLCGSAKEGITDDIREIISDLGDLRMNIDGHAAIGWMTDMLKNSFDPRRN